jgi:hypothetical protein
MWVRKAWTLTAAGRMDWFQNYDGSSCSGTGGWVPAHAAPQFDQRVFDPRVGPFAQALRSLGGFGVGLPRLSRAHAQRTLPLNAGGQPAHLPNGNLLSERATGLGDRPGHASGAGAASAPATSSPRSTGPSTR